MYVCIDETPIPFPPLPEYRITHHPSPITHYNLSIVWNMEYRMHHRPEDIHPIIMIYAE